MGLGLMLGPVIAIFITKFLNYGWTLVVFAALVGSIAFTATFFIPKRIDVDMDGEKQMKDIPWKHFLKNSRNLSSIFLNVIASMVLIFLDPVLVLRL